MYEVAITTEKCDNAKHLIELVVFVIFYKRNETFIFLWIIQPGLPLIFAVAAIGRFSKIKKRTTFTVNFRRIELGGYRVETNMKFSSTFQPSVQQVFESWKVL